MKILAEFERRLPPNARGVFTTFKSPAEVQRYLDSLPYVGENRDRCPLDVMKDGQCHCLDGGLLAALALRRLRYPGLLIDLVPSRDRWGRNLDDDHVLAVFRRHGAWGAVAKSNYAWLRYREPVYRTLRELVMSYFEVYFNAEGIKALRGYTRPLDISMFDDRGFAWDERESAKVYRRLYQREMVPLISKESSAELQPVDRRAYESGTVGVDLDWVYHPASGKPE
jgi:hypothetical protein